MLAVNKRVSVRNLFHKAPKPLTVDEPPPVFHKHDEQHLLRAYKLGTIGLSASSRSSPQKKNPLADSNGVFVIPPFKGAKKALSTGSGDSYFEEEIIEEEEYYEEEIIEEEIIEEVVIEETPPRKITIRFDGFDEMRTTIHIDDYAKSEINKSWYKREDYDKMVQSARKTVQKLEEQKKEAGKNDNKKLSEHEIRGLEAWNTVGSVKTRMLKESALEAVWNEQSRQWNKKDNDPEKMREAYQRVSKGAQNSAAERAETDAQIVEQLKIEDKKELEKKRRQRLLGKSKAMLGKSIRMTAGTFKKTGKAIGHTTLKTGKVMGKTAVATATLDKRMLMEALAVEKRKRDSKPQIIREPSKSSLNTLDLAMSDGKSFIETAGSR